MHEPLWVVFLLLPAAAWSGWYAGRRGTLRGGRADEGGSSRPDYFKGINYLLNEQPDKAIEAFIQALEVDSETVETHLALGNLYRRRGEVDRAIRIHQNLVARPSLTHEQRSEALLELGQDYLSAGLLDRAENLFRELAESQRYRARALHHMVDIYEREKDWDKAIEAARELGRATGRMPGDVIAQYYCEQAARLLDGGEPEQALDSARRALASHKACVRASLVEGDALVALQEYEEALRAYERVASQVPAYVPETLSRVQRCLEHQGRPEMMHDFLSELLDRHDSASVTLALAELKRRDQGTERAVEFLTQALRRRPSVRALDRLLELQLDGNPGNDSEHLSVVRNLTRKLLEDRPVYRCRHCGFPARSLHWQCPGCKCWNTVQPIHGVEGE